MVENGRVVENACVVTKTTGLCVVTKTNAWKTARCESVERRKRGLSDHFLVEARLKLVGGWRV